MQCLRASRHTYDSFPVLDQLMMRIRAAKSKAGSAASSVQTSLREHCTIHLAVSSAPNGPEPLRFLAPSRRLPSLGMPSIRFSGYSPPESRLPMWGTPEVSN